MTTARSILAGACIVLAACRAVAAGEPAAEAFPPPLVSEDPQAPSPYWLDDVRNCGPRCLQFLEHWFGGGRSFREISTLCPPLQDGVPLEALAQAAGELGWGVSPFSSSARQLARVQPPGCAEAHQRQGPWPGWYAVDVSFVHGLERQVIDERGQWLASPRGCDYSYFQRFEPVERIGGSILIYQITPAAANAVRSELGLAELPGRGATGQ